MGIAGALVVGSSHSFTILTELALIDAGSSGSEKPVSSEAVVDQPSCEFSAACIAAARHGTVGRLSVPSTGAPGIAKYRSYG